MCLWQDIQYCLGSTLDPALSPLEPGQARLLLLQSFPRREAGRGRSHFLSPTLAKAINRELNAEMGNEGRKDG